MASAAWIFRSSTTSLSSLDDIVPGEDRVGKDMVGEVRVG